MAFEFKVATFVKYPPLDVRTILLPPGEICATFAMVGDAVGLRLLLGILVRIDSGLGSLITVPTKRFVMNFNENAPAKIHNTFR